MGIICDRNVPLKLKGKFYHTTIRLLILYDGKIPTRKYTQCYIDKNVVLDERTC